MTVAESNVLTDENTSSMVTHIKTTIDIADNLLSRAKRKAGDLGVTLKELTEEGLELVLEKKSRRAAKTLRLVTFGRKSGAPVSLDWDRIRDLVY